MPGPYFTKKPEFMPSLHDWGADRSLDAPDPRQVGLEDTDMFKILRAMLGSGGYMEYLAALKKQRDKAGAPAPTPTPAPPSPSPTPNDIQRGLERGYGPSDAEKKYRELVGG